MPSFVKSEIIPLAGSASLLNNNLSCGAESNFAVAHRSVVHTVTMTSTDTKVNHRSLGSKEGNGTPSNALVNQVKWVELKSRSLLVIATHKGIQIYGPDLSQLLFFHSLSNQGDSSVFARGIASVDDQFVCVGTSRGLILMFLIAPSGSNVSILATIRGHNCAIADLDGDGQLMASGDGEGIIRIWQASGQTLECRHIINETNNDYVTSIRLIKDRAVAVGYGKGQIRIFDVQKAILLAEIGAHARAVSALSVSPSTSLLASVSEDSFLRVFQLVSSSGSFEISQAHAECLTDMQLTGVVFVSESKIATVAFDSSEIILLTDN